MFVVYNNRLRAFRVKRDPCIRLALDSQNPASLENLAKADPDSPFNCTTKKETYCEILIVTFSNS